MRLRWFPFIVAFILLSAACTSGDDGSSVGTPVDSITIRGTDSLRFEPSQVTVAVGTEVTVTLVSGAAVEHDLVLAGAVGHGMVGADGHGPHGGDHMVEAGGLHVVHAAAGMSESATMVMGTPGTYEAYCSIPGHRGAGMIMAFHVVEAP